MYPKPPEDAAPEPCRLQVAGEWAEAAREWASLGCPYEAALALHDASDEAALRQAPELFTGLGAPAAAKLVLSTRTVDHHVSAVLAKLGAPTRAAAHAPPARTGRHGRKIGTTAGKLGNAADPARGAAAIQSL